MNRALHLLLDLERLPAGGESGDSLRGPDAGLSGLLGFMRERSITATVLCADPDGSVRPMLHDAGWDEVRVVTERACWLPGEQAGAPREHAVFPFANTGCDRCPHCTRNLMLGSAGDGDVLIYAGDGHRDPCPAAYADIVFARGMLQAWCQQQNITYYPFASFEDVRRRLASGCALRPRPRAERKRREAYLIEA